MARADLLALVEDVVRGDDARLRAGAGDRALDEAVRRYSKDRPRRAVADIAGTGAHLVEPPAGWEPGSAVVGLEVPAGQAPPAIRPAGDLVPYDHPDGVRLMWRPTPPPGPADTARVTFTVRHRLTAFEDTIPEADRLAVASLAASLLLEQLAAATAGDTDTTIPADAVDHRGASDRYAARARSARKAYDDHLSASGPAPGRSAGASASIAWEPRRGLLRRGAT
ncbi:hypothetical protein HL658_31355 [Azospirillum sp. RWY-5-1]|uniref:Uncharacterized protein n=1 Tax=Azospirillum oleiclasticum TaxID=2735135 RepID=A0ABX2TJP9_9PROT|nr:hypothetical protein [Azospirillum oleiclasticum]NYZ17063.1 hypothetical protein [Azospirillum oleiclasticum]NYZ24493.1 hypothetical protein [Azospirillum oleiclasticum]